MSRFYDKDGSVMELLAWARKVKDADYKVVARDKNGSRLVSTVWLGLDYNFRAEGPPIIFETMVFDDSCNDLDGERYSTLEQAQEGHKRFCEKWLGA